MSAATTGCLPPITLVLGGARSGKSRYAEGLVEGHGAERSVYVATAAGQETGDPEMAARIREHKTRRGAGWRTVEEALDLTGVLLREAGRDRAVLVDCLTLWISNLMAADRDIDAAVAGLCDGLPRLSGPVVFVSNEVGLGIVPMNQVARDFRDHSGRTHQAIAALADSVIFMVAGLPMTVKSNQ